MADKTIVIYEENEKYSQKDFQYDNSTARVD